MSEEKMIKLQGIKIMTIAPKPYDVDCIELSKSSLEEQFECDKEKTIFKPDDEIWVKCRVSDMEIKVKYLKMVAHFPSEPKKVELPHKLEQGGYIIEKINDIIDYLTYRDGEKR
jgi:hypothetical protein